jgi:hypothetical protein
MTHPSQTVSRNISAMVCGPEDPALGGGRRFARAVVPRIPEPPRRASVRAIRQTVPAVDPATVFGCVDWFLYPAPERERASG